MENSRTLESYLKYELEGKLRNLRDRARNTAAALSHLVLQIEATIEMDEKPGWNSLGELQGSGGEIDRLCGETRLLWDALSLLKKEQV